MVVIKATQENDLAIRLAAHKTAGGITVNALAVVYSNSMPLPRQASFGIELQFSGTPVNVLVEVMQGNQEPATEGTLDANFAVPENSAGSSVGKVAEITDEDVHVINFAPVVSGFLLLRLTGQGLNGVDTKLIRARFVYTKGQ